MPTFTLNTGNAHAIQQSGRNTSVSQIEVAEACLRKWWLQKEAKIKRPQKHYFIVGGRLHDVGERFLRGEADIYTPGWDASLEPEESQWLQSRVGMAIEQGIWQVEPGAFIEWPLCMLVGDEFLDANGMPLVCRTEIGTRTNDEGEEIRVILPPSSLLDGSPLPRGWDRLPYLAGFIDHYNPKGSSNQRPRVSDHKTAKNRRYGKRKKDIQQALQMLVYSCLPFYEFPHIDAIEARYNVFIKDLQEAKPVYAVQDIIHRQQAAARWQGVISITERMEQLRREFPNTYPDPKDIRRGELYRKVPGAVDTRDTKRIDAACGAYGGCEFKDACFGRGCTIEKLTSLYDNHQPPDKEHLKKVTYTLNTQANQGVSNMPFDNAQPAFTVGQDVFLKDPSAPQQYKARIATLQPITLAIWPEVDKLPVFDQLPSQYRLQIGDTSSISVTSDPNIPLMGYKQALIAANMDAGEPLSIEPTAAQAVGTQPTTQHTPGPQPSPDGKFSLNTGGQSIEKQEGQVPPAINPSPTPPTGQEWQPRVGDIVKVNNEEGYWAQHAGKQATVLAVDADGLITIDMEGNTYPDIKSSRVCLISSPQQQNLPPPSDAGTQQTIPDIAPELQAHIAECQAWVGKLVHIQHSNIDTSFRGVVEKVGMDGIKIDRHVAPLKWEIIGSIQSGEEVPIPGDEKDAKRVAKKKHLEGLTINTALIEINNMINAGLEKKQPGLGKRDISKVKEYLDVAIQLAASQIGNLAATAGAVASQSQNSSLDTDAAFKAGFEDAKKAALQAVGDIIPL